MKVNSLTIDLPQTNDKRAASQDSPLAKRAAPPDTAAIRSEPPAGAARPVTKPIVNGVGLGLEFALDEATGRSIIRVIDEETGKIVRQIPPEEVLNFLRQFESINGPVLSRKF